MILLGEAFLAAPTCALGKCGGTKHPPLPPLFIADLQAHLYLD